MRVFDEPEAALRWAITWPTARQRIGKAVRGCGSTRLARPAGRPWRPIRSSGLSRRAATAIEAVRPCWRLRSCAPTWLCGHHNPANWGSPATTPIATSLGDRAVHAATALRLLPDDAARVAPGKRAGEITNKLAAPSRSGVSRKGRRGQMAPHWLRTAAGSRSVSARLKSRKCSPL
jgi:hypothetical protein